VQRGLLSHRLVPVAVAAGAALAACAGGDGDGGYGPDERPDFVEACSAGTAATEEACECFYDRLVDEVPHERFERVDEQIRTDPSAIPDDIAAMAVECSAAQPGGD
jgi:hypothetical protein